MTDKPQPVTIDVETINRILKVVYDEEMSYQPGSAESIALFKLKNKIEQLGGAT